MKKINDNTLFYILSAVISLAAIAFIVLLCCKSFDSRSVYEEKDTYSEYSEYSETAAETENHVSDERTVTDKFFGVDVIYID